MARFSSKEKEFIDEYIKDNTLRTSLSVIRECMEELWRSDAPRIVQDFTDHGEKHCERLVAHVDNLLKANDGKKLTELEMYLLLAGVYLHDIGMQCDVVKFPAIKEKAKELGAKFELKFTAKTASRYSIEEQVSIRENHHYLTAAWISYAYKTGQTIVGSALNKFPNNLVSDLIDVCKYHSKLPITDCKSSFMLDPTMRKRLILALLRFSNELDIVSNRVSLETVKNFSFDPHSCLYWWLHNRTYISFVKENLVHMTITLNSEDIKLYGSLMQQEFIDKFKRKNELILDVLAEENIPIRVDSNSKVEEYEFTEKLPTDVISILDHIQPRQLDVGPLYDLAEEVKTWLQVIKYKIIEFKRFNERTIDIIAISPFEQRCLIRCIGGEIGKEDVNELDEILDRKTPQGWLISDKRVSQKARERAIEDGAPEVFTLKEFIRQKVWKQYFDILESLVENENIPELYIDIGCYKERLYQQEIFTEEYLSLDSYIDDWLLERGKTHISLLGEFGTGKTWFCRHYAYRQLKRYLEDPVNQRLPLLITLRDFTKSADVNQLINDALLEKYKLPFVGSAFDAFQRINQQGKLLLILDGFDEMALKVDYQTVVDNFWELAKLVDKNSKVILTSRNEYFRWAEESEKILSGKEFGRRGILIKPPEFEVLYVKHFSKDQIREVITKRMGSIDGFYIAERILNRENLAAMARKPLLLELLLTALNEANDSILENLAQVYLYATNKLLLRNIETRRTFTSTTNKLYFLCEMAWEMIKSDELKIHYREIPERIRSYFGTNIGDQHELDTWDFDLRNQTLLHRNSAGYYEFAHKSLAEYFVAFKFAAELGVLDSLYTRTYCDELDHYCQIHLRKNSMYELVQTFGSVKLMNKEMKAVRDLLYEIVSKNAAEKYWEIIEFTRNKKADEIKYLGGNAATLLHEKGEILGQEKSENTMLKGRNLRFYLKGVNLKGANLEETNLEEANLEETNLEEANLKGTNLKGTNFKATNLQEAVLKDANLQEANLEKANLQWANFEAANLVGTRLRRANLRLANLGRANLRWANLFEANFEAANLEAANLQEAILKDANLKDANLEKANLKGANLIGTDLAGANLAGANLVGTCLGGSNLRLANLGRANLGEANLRWANLVAANLEEANLFRADLEGAIFEGADLERANLEGAYHLSHAQLSKVKTLYDTKLDKSLLILLKEKYHNLFEAIIF